MTSRETIHQLVVSRLLAFVPGSQPGFGELVSEIIEQLEMDSDFSVGRIDEYCGYFVSKFGRTE